MSDSFEQILVNSSSGLSAETARMNVIAGNLANAGSIGKTEESTYHKKYPVFSEVKQKIAGLSDADQPIGGVRVTKLIESKGPLDKRYEPDNPMADKDGFIYLTNVNPIEEMTNMIAASKEYEANANMISTTKNLLAESLNVLKE